MNFVLKMAWRDSRTSRRKLILSSFSIVLGIAALVAIGSFSANLRQAIELQAKGLLGADLAVASRLPLPKEAGEAIDALSAERAHEVSFASMVVFPASTNQTRLVSVRALDGPYPFYGDLVTSPALNQADFLRGTDAAVVEETLMAQYGAQVGDPLKVGRKTFRIAAVLRKIPGDSVAVTLLSPRVYIPLRDLADTALLGPGSLVRYKTYLKFSDNRDITALVKDLGARFGELRLHFDTVEERKRDLGQSLKNVYSFLSLVGFVALLLGAIGVASAIHAYIQQKVATVAILRCLGSTARQSFSIYLLQGVAIGLIGAIVGAALGVGLQILIPTALHGLLPIDVTFFVSWMAVSRGMIAGMVICLLFSLLPLLAVRRISPLEALRSSIPERSPPDPLRLLLYALIALGIVAFALSQTERKIVGLGFAAALTASFGILTVAARVVIWATRRFTPRRLPYVWRQGIANLHRPNNRTVLLLLALGVGTFLMLTMALTRATLLSQIRNTGGKGRPNLIFFDIQDDQIEPLKRLLVAQGSAALAEAPVVTMRLQGLKGRTVEELLKDPSTHLPAWTLRREYRSTYRRSLANTEKVSEGSFVGRVAADVPIIPISLEEGLAREMKLALGDEVDWDVQGVSLKTRVASLRKVEWQRLQPNFFVVFPEGVLESAPKFFIVATRVPSPSDSARIQQAIVREYPNVSAIDLGLILQTLDGIFSKIEYAVQFMALFTMGTGAIVLMGALVSGRAQRIRESVLLRTLGASRRQLIQIQIVEYVSLGILAALIGGSLAYGANALLARFVFEAPQVAPLKYLLAALFSLATLTLVAGTLASRGIANHPPLQILREET